MWVTADLLAQPLFKTSIHFVICSTRSRRACYVYSLRGHKPHDNKVILKVSWNEEVLDVEGDESRGGSCPFRLVWDRYVEETHLSQFQAPDNTWERRDGRGVQGTE